MVWGHIQWKACCQKPLYSEPCHSVMPLLSIDIDNVLSDTDTVIRQVAYDHTNGRVRLDYEDVVAFDYRECKDKRGNSMSTPEWNAIHDAVMVNHAAEFAPLDGAIDAVTRLADHFNLLIVTSRPQHVAEITQRWLATQGFPDHELLFSEPGGKHVAGPKPDFAVDDDREQAYAFHFADVRAILFAHPWNKVGPYSPIERVGDWEQICEILL